jgi:hypothetical protein
MVRPLFSRVFAGFAYRVGIHARPNLASFCANGTKKLQIEAQKHSVLVIPVPVQGAAASDTMQFFRRPQPAASPSRRPKEQEENVGTIVVLCS